MASTVYNLFKEGVGKGLFDLSTGTYKVMLVQTGYTPDPDHDYVSDITGGTNYELNSSGSGSGYTAGFAGSGRKTLASLAFAKDDTLDIAKWTASDATWTAINAGTIRYAVVYKSNTADSDSKLCVCMQITDYPTTGGDFTLSLSSGIWILA